MSIVSINGKALSAISKVFGVLKASISAVNGILVSSSSAAWVDAVAPGSTDTDLISETSFAILCKITADQTGTCTKVRIWNTAISTVTLVNIKMALYDGSFNLLASGVVTVSTITVPDDSWIECTLSASTGVTASTVYYVGFEPASNPCFIARYLSAQASGSSQFNFGSSYAAFPQNPATGLSANAALLSVGIFIVP